MPMIVFDENNADTAVYMEDGHPPKKLTGDQLTWLHKLLNNEPSLGHGYGSGASRNTPIGGNNNTAATVDHPAKLSQKEAIKLLEDNNLNTEYIADAKDRETASNKLDSVLSIISSALAGDDMTQKTPAYQTQEYNKRGLYINIQHGKDDDSKSASYSLSVIAGDRDVTTDGVIISVKITYPAPAVQPPKPQSMTVAATPPAT